MDDLGVPLFLETPICVKHPTRWSPVTRYLSLALQSSAIMKAIHHSQLPQEPRKRVQSEPRFEKTPSGYEIHGNTGCLIGMRDAF